MTAAPVWSVDPRTGKQREQAGTESTAADVDAAVRAAHAARGALADHRVRAAFLRAAAGRIDAARDELVSTADAETALGVPRLTGEVGRTSGQLRAFADEVEDGAYLGAVIDHAAPDAAPPRPDLRRYRVPLGVVAVYGASNFPLAFSVPGGDTASALAAGCPVVVKAHPGHPATSVLTARALRAAAADTGLPEDIVSIVQGFEAGVELVKHPLVTAAGFTGSVRGGRALHDAAAARPVPIPFHGELGSLNPVVVTEAAAEERAEEVGAGLAGSMTMGTGQFCTKPGLVFAPEGAAGDRLVDVLTDKVGEAAQGTLLNEGIRKAFLAGAEARAAIEGVTTPVAAGPGEGTGVEAGFFALPAAQLATGGEHELLLEECFGPVTVVARYRDADEITAVLSRLTGNLTATLQLGTAEAESEGGRAAELMAELTPLAGRVLVGGWPTGVAVVAAQHHGGPYPATTSTSTSVGVTAIERWLRPVAYQDAPEALLPQELRESNPLGLPRRVDNQHVPGRRTEG